MSQPIRLRRLGLGTVVFTVTLLLRALVLSRLARSPFLFPHAGDTYFYNDWAQRILHGGAPDHLAFYGLPGYAYLLAFIYKTLGYNPFVPGLFQALLDSGTALLIYHLALRFFPKQEPINCRPGPT